jgi:hypothetical protein
VLPDMAARGWDCIRTPLVRFWEGERSLDRIMRGVHDERERDLLEYARSLYFFSIYFPFALAPQQFRVPKSASTCLRVSLIPVSGLLVFSSSPYLYRALVLIWFMAGTSTTRTLPR